ncbi:MAG: CPBP family intramembrane metalloprotease [Clostridia bacterium]|nr:CPBP family intramembrane metalloprotease [Clostridia bacterium]
MSENSKGFGGKFLKYLKMIGLVVIYLFTYLAVSVVGMFIFTIILTIRAMIESKGNADMNNLMATIEPELMKYSNAILIVACIISFAAYWLIFIIRKENLFRVCNFSRVDLKSIGILAILAIMANIFISYAISYMVKIPVFGDRLKEYEELIEMITAGNPIVSILAVGIFAPIFEEILFRGLVLNELRKNIPVWPAVIIQGVLFGAYHGNLIQGVYAAVLGVLLGMVYIWGKSIWVPIFVHMVFNNSSIFLSSYLGGEAGGFKDMVFLIASAAVLVFIVFYYKKFAYCNGRGRV